MYRNSLFGFEGTKCESTRLSAIAVAKARRIHLFPFRTQKLSSFASKILGG